MKGFVAACLAAVPEMAERASWRRPVHLFISYDEEIGCDGARRLIAGPWTSPAASPALCVVGEPSGDAADPGAQGQARPVVRVRGLPGHSSQPALGVNAVHAAAEAIA